jgi:DNA-binding IclR family transcriptional regulator
MASVRWTFLTNHAQVLVCIARDPGIRLRDIADRVGITERSAYGIVVDLADARRPGSDPRRSCEPDVRTSGHGV